MTVDLLAFVGLALFATSVSIIMKLSLIVRHFLRVSWWTSWCKSSSAEGDMTSYGKHPTLQEMKNRTCSNFRCDAEIQVFWSLVTFKVCFEGVFSSLLKLILLSRNLWWGLSELDELRERSSHYAQYVEDSDDRAWYQMCNILRVRIFWPTLSCYILLLSVIWENRAKRSWMRDDIVDNRVVTTVTWRSEVQMNVQSTTRDPQECTRRIRTWIFWWSGTTQDVNRSCSETSSSMSSLTSHRRETYRSVCACPIFSARMSNVVFTLHWEIRSYLFWVRTWIHSGRPVHEDQIMSHIIRVTDAHWRRSFDVWSDVLECDRRDWHDERALTRNTWTIVGPDSMEDVFVGLRIPTTWHSVNAASVAVVSCQPNQENFIVVWFVGFLSSIANVLFFFDLISVYE